MYNWINKFGHQYTAFCNFILAVLLHLFFLDPTKEFNYKMISLLFTFVTLLNRVNFYPSDFVKLFQLPFELILFP